MRSTRRIARPYGVCIQCTVAHLLSGADGVYVYVHVHGPYVGQRSKVIRRGRPSRSDGRVRATTSDQSPRDKYLPHAKCSVLSTGFRHGRQKFESSCKVRVEGGGDNTLASRAKMVSKKATFAPPALLTGRTIQMRVSTITTRTRFWGCMGAVYNVTGLSTTTDIDCFGFRLGLSRRERGDDDDMLPQPWVWA